MVVAVTTGRDAGQHFDAVDGARRSGTPAAAGDALMLGNERARLNALWAAGPAGFCRQAIAGRYPFVRNAGSEVTAEDFGRFFAAGGIMDDFFSKHLATQVDMTPNQWRWRAGESATTGISREALNQFQRAARLRDTFFAAGGRQPSLRFELRPVAADAAFTRVTLEIEGQPVVFLTGQTAQATALSLPGGTGGNLVRFDTAPPLRSEWRTEGPWAWLRMLDRGQLQATGQAERYRLQFDLDGHGIDYLLTASSALNPLRREVLEQFRCPAAL